MKTVAYFAYGSNMLMERLRARCPSATPVGVAVAENHELILSLPGGGPSGKAGLVAKSGASVPGVVFEMTVADAVALDAHEGPSYRRAERFEIAGHATVTAMTYVARPEALGETHHPFDWYRALVLAGAMQHRLDDGHIERIAAITAVADPDPHRVQRKAALAALETAGFAGLLNEPA